MALTFDQYVQQKKKKDEENAAGKLTFDQYVTQPRLEQRAESSDNLLMQAALDMETPRTISLTQTRYTDPLTDMAREEARLEPYYGRGNINLNDRPVYRNPDGSISTVHSFSTNIDGKEVLLPQIGRDKNGNPVRWTEDEAINNYFKTGEHLGIFDTIAEADDYANWLHEQQAERYGDTANAPQTGTVLGKHTVASGAPGGGGRGLGAEDLEKQARELKDTSALAPGIRFQRKYGGLTGAEDFAEASGYQEELTEEGPAANDLTRKWEFPLYEIVNGNDEARDAYTARRMNLYGGGMNPLGALWGGVADNAAEAQDMTEDEVKLFNYIYHTQGREAAQEFYDDIQSDLNARRRIREQEEWGAYAKEKPFESSLFSVVESPLRGMSYLGQAADLMDDGKIDQNAGYNRFTQIPGDIRSTISNEIEDSGKWGKVGSFLYQTGMSMGDFLMSTAVSGGNEALSLAIMGTGAAANTVITAKERGLSDKQAFALGTIAGAAEVITEKVSLEALLDKTSLTRSALGYFLKNILAEGSEEVGSDVINLVADTLIAKDKSEWKTAMRKLREENPELSEKDAFWRVFLDQAQQMGTDFLGGAISGGVMAGGSIAVNAAANYATEAPTQRMNRAIDRAYIAMETNGMFSPEARAPQSAFARAEQIELENLQQQAAMNADTVSQYAAQMEQSGQITPTMATVLNNMHGGSQDFGDYTREMMAAYNAGKAGTDINQIRTKTITPDQQQAAYLAGQGAGNVEMRAAQADTANRFQSVARAAQDAGTQAQTATDTTMQETGAQAQKTPAARVSNPGFVQDEVSNRAKLTHLQKRALDTIGKTLGVRVRMVESITTTDADGTVRKSGVQGYYDNGEIVLARDADDPFLVNAVHESVHRIRELSESDYSYLSGFVTRNMSDSSYGLAEIIKGMDGYTTEEIPEEIIADAFGRMLGNEKAMRQFVAENSTASQRIMDVFAEIFDRIKRALSGGNVKSLTENQRKVYEDLAGRMDVMLKYYQDAVDVAKVSDGTAAESREDAGNRKYSRTDNVLISEATKTADRAVGIQVDEGTESVSPTAKLSLRSYRESDYVQDRETAAKDLSDRLGITVGKAKRYIDAVNSVAKMIADDRVRLDYESSPGRSSFVGNTEYGGSIDFSTVCKKRRLYTGTIDAIQRAMPDKALTADEMLKIRAEMKKRGYEVSCGLCYVEGSRVNIGKYTQEFLDELKGTDMYVPTMAEINTTDGQEQLRAEHPEVYEQYVKFMNKLAQRKPKLFQMATEYQGEILKKFKNDSTVEQKNRNGGLRLQSFSDFEIIHLIDCMQVIMDMSRVGLAGQAYTKVPDFAWALGDTGLKINLSMIAKGVDPQGHIIYDEVEGMKHADARKLRDRYSKNVGTILVVFNDAQLKAALNDSFVDFIIPFHRSQWNKGQYEMLGLPTGASDYTMQQNESYLDGRKNANGKTIRPDNFMPNEYWDFSKTGKENAETYLRMCAEDGRRPKFYKLLVDNGDGSFSLQPDGSTDGYWKLLTDFKMYDNDGKGSPQMPVRPDFNMDEAARMLSTYEGGHAKFPAAQDVVDDFVNGKFSRSDRESTDAVMAQVDSSGKSLSRGQAEFFKDSKVRDENGNLLIMYHGTNTPGFTVFDPSYSDDKRSLFFTSNPMMANSYTYAQDWGKNVDPYNMVTEDSSAEDFNKAAEKINSPYRVTKITKEWLDDRRGWYKQLTDEIIPYGKELYQIAQDLYGNSADGRNKAVLTSMKLLSKGQIDKQVLSDVRSLLFDNNTYWGSRQSTESKKAQKRLQKLEPTLRGLVDDAERVVIAADIPDSEIGKYVWDAMGPNDSYAYEIGTRKRGFSGGALTGDLKTVMRSALGRVNMMKDRSFGNRYATYVNLTNPFVLDAGTHITGPHNIEVDMTGEGEIRVKVLEKDEYGYDDVVFRQTFENTDDGHQQLKKMIGDEAFNKLLKFSEESKQKERKYHSDLSDEEYEEYIREFYPETQSPIYIRYNDYFDSTVNTDIVRPGKWNDLTLNGQGGKTTREVAEWAQNNGYDGVLLKNVKDPGGYSAGDPGPGTIAIAFSSEQVKSIDNLNPTYNPDIRYSRSSRESTDRAVVELEESQRKNYDFNQQQTEVGSTLRTLGQPGKSGSQIKRSKYGVGKDIGGTIYLHRDYATDVIPAEVYESALQTLQENYPDFQFNCVEYNPKDNTVRFDEAPGFDTEREPVVGDYVRVNADGTTKQGHTDYIWHHKWLWVKDDYKGFNVRDSWEWSKQWLSTINGKTYNVNGKQYNDRATSDGNGIDRWNAQLDAYGLPRDDDVAPVRQAHTSRGTSINVKKVPALYSKATFQPGTVNIDIGAGVEGTPATAYLKDQGVDSMPFDPFNRSLETNKAVTDFLERGEQADTATCSNCLNVIDNADARANVILQMAKAIKPDGTAYFTVYENKANLDAGKAGEVKAKPDQWQEFRDTKSYVPEIEQYFDDVKVKNGLIIARSPKPNLPKATWQISSTEYTDSEGKRPYTKDQAVRFSKSDRELLDDYIEQYGAIDEGERPSRKAPMPKRTTDKTKLSMTVRTVAEAGATPETFVPTIENLAANHEFDYTPYADEAAIKDAQDTVENKGWQTTLADWEKDVGKGVTSKRNTAIGWALYNNAVNAGDTETALTVLRDIVASQRNAAQALQGTRILKQLNPETQLYNAERTVESLNEQLRERYGKKAPDLQIDNDLAERFLHARTKETRDAAMADIYKDIGRQMPSTFLDRWTAWRYLAMLGNPRTHVRNIVGNAGFMPVVAAKDLTATAIESAVNLVTGGKIERTKGNVIGRGDLMKAAWNDYANIREEALGEGKYNDRQIAMKEIQDARKIFGNTRSTAWNKTGGAALEAFRKANGTALDAEDVWFSKPHYTLALAQYCAANHISAEQIAKGEGLAKAREYAIKEAQKATYRDTNDFSQMVSRLGRGTQWGNSPAGKVVNTLMEGVLPFRKTPANILVRGIEYSPIGLMKALTYDTAQVSKGNMTAAEMIDDVSAGLTGTGLMALGAYLVAQGLLRGRGGSDDKKKKMEDVEGHQEYAIELPDGTSITLDWLAPEALPLFVGANIAELMQENNDTVKMADVLSAIGNVTEPMLQMSMLQSLNDIFEAVGYAKEGDLNALTSALSSSVTSYLTQAFPTLLGQIERTGESGRRQTYTDKNQFLTGDMQYTLGKISAKLPWWDYNQIPYIDAWGREELTGKPLERAFNNFINPAFVSKVNESDMEKELMRVYEATGESVFPQRPAKFFNVNGERKDLTGDEYVQYATQRGQTSYALVGKIVETDAYKQASDAQKAEYIKDAYTYADQTAKTLFGASISDSYKWVEKAQTGKERYNISPDVYLNAKYLCADVQSLKDRNGKAIDNSSGLQKMEAIYSIPGLNDDQRRYLFECFGVGSTVINYNRAAVSAKLKEMRGK